jgi:hypothetical protein
VEKMQDLKELDNLKEVKPPSLDKNLEDENKPKINRKCGECTMCCQGWLTGEAHGYSFYPGMPCHYVGCSGCSIYEDRPEDPCKSYKCIWLGENDLLPEWFRPDQSKLICTWREWKDEGEDNYYLDVIECGEEIKSKYLQWLIRFHCDSGINMSYSLSGTRCYYGSDEFIQWSNEQFQDQ